MEIHLKIIGWLLMLLAGAHSFFPWYFDWKQNLTSLSLINKQMLQVHTFFIALLLVLIGLLCVTSTTDLMETQLGTTICIGLTIFWGIRLFFQWFVYSSKLWKGKVFETTMHVLFTLFWIYLIWVFGTIGFDF